MKNLSNRSHMRPIEELKNDPQYSELTEKDWQMIEDARNNAIKNRENATSAEEHYKKLKEMEISGRFAS